MEDAIELGFEGLDRFTDKYYDSAHDGIVSHLPHHKKKLQELQERQRQQQKRTRPPNDRRRSKSEPPRDHNKHDRHEHDRHEDRDGQHDQDRRSRRGSEYGRSREMTKEELSGPPQGDYYDQLRRRQGMTDPSEDDSRSQPPQSYPYAQDEYAAPGQAGHDHGYSPRGSEASFNQQYPAAIAAPFAAASFPMGGARYPSPVDSHSPRRPRSEHSPPAKSRSKSRDRNSRDRNSRDRNSRGDRGGDRKRAKSATRSSKGSKEHSVMPALAGAIAGGLAAREYKKGKEGNTLAALAGALVGAVGADMGYSEWQKKDRKKDTKKEGGRRPADNEKGEKVGSRRV